MHIRNHDWPNLNRRLFLRSTAAAAAIATTRRAQALADADLKPIDREIANRHGESIQRLQDWIHQPAIAAEDRGMDAGCDLMMRMLRDAGLDEVKKGLLTDTPESLPRSILAPRRRSGSISRTT